MYYHFVPSYSSLSHLKKLSTTISQRKTIPTPSNLNWNERNFLKKKRISCYYQILLIRNIQLVILFLYVIVATQTSAPVFYLKIFFVLLSSSPPSVGRIIALAIQFVYANITYECVHDMNLKFNLSRPSVRRSTCKIRGMPSLRPGFWSRTGLHTRRTASQLYYNSNNTAELGEVVLSCSFAWEAGAGRSGGTRGGGSRIAEGGGGGRSEGKSKSY